MIQVISDEVNAAVRVWGRKWEKNSFVEMHPHISIEFLTIICIFSLDYFRPAFIRACDGLLNYFCFSEHLLLSVPPPAPLPSHPSFVGLYLSDKPGDPKRRCIASSSLSQTDMPPPPTTSFHVLGKSLRQGSKVEPTAMITIEDPQCGV